MDMPFVQTALLPGAVGIIMFGLGLALIPADFARVLRFPRAVLVGLLVQTIVLVTVAFGIAHLFALPPALAVGLMLLAASPGGALANIFSHLADGDVALNITLTAVNSVLALAWVPLVLNWSLGYFMGPGHFIAPPAQKIFEVATIIVLPVALGMVVRRLALPFALRAQNPVRVLSIVLLAVVIGVAIGHAGAELLDHFAAVGLACLAFNLTSMTLGYLAPRALGLPTRQAISIAFEIGVHNSAIAIYIALSALANEAAAIPAGIYGLVQIATASLAVAWLRRRRASPLGRGST
ncbi:MAG TPA: bile acid:sodium symporter family protein [Steroidobacteraceae bacterium]